MKDERVVELIMGAKINYQNSKKTLIENKEYLKKMYEDLSVSYDLLSRETEESIEMMEKIIASALKIKNPSDAYNNFLEKMKICFTSSNHKFMEVMMDAKRKQLSETQRDFKKFLSAKCDEVLKVRSTISDYWLIKQPEPTPVPKLLPTNTAKSSSFKPKLGNQSDPPKYSAVCITNIVHPNHMYMQLDDKDLPSYHHMLEELQKEFCTATKQSASHCPSPVAGEAYALQLGDMWHRVLIEKHKVPMVFYVDTGLRKDVHPSMIFHHLPERFMSLEAQAIKCVLYGIAPRRQPTIKKTHKNDSYSKELTIMLQKHVGSRAVAIIKKINAGKVGCGREKSTSTNCLNKELSVHVILYVNGAAGSINTEVGRSDMGRFVLSQKIDLQEHSEIRRKAQLDVGYSAPKIGFETLVPSLKTDDNKPTGDPAVSCSTLLFTDESYDSSFVPDVNDGLPTKKLDEAKKEKELVTGFPVTLVRVQSPDHITFRTPELNDKFLKMQNGLYTHFEANKESVEEPIINFEMGFVGAVNCDGRCYRAVVSDVGTYPEIKVALIDKDVSRVIHASDLHRLPQELEDFPKTVIQCSLSGIGPPTSSGWKPEVIQHITSRLKETVQIVIKCQDNLIESEGIKTLPVCIYVDEKDADKITGSSRINLAEELVSFGLASESPCM